VWAARVEWSRDGAPSTYIGAIAVSRAHSPNPGGRLPASGAALQACAVVAAAGGLVAAFDATISARVSAGTDAALRLSVLYPYLGVGRAYVLARALGLTALVAAALAVALGLELGRARAGGRAPSPDAARLHRQLGLVAVALAAAHATVPYTDIDPPYGGWRTALVPFGQPSSWGLRASALESGGIVALYLMVLLGPSWYLLRRRRRLWGAVHVLTVAVYAIAVLHALFLGSDFAIAGSARVALIAAQAPVCLVLARRIAAPGSAERAAGRAALRRAGAVLALLGAAAVAGVAAAGVAGAALGGLRL